MSSPENEGNCEPATIINQDSTGIKDKEIITILCSPNDVAHEEETENGESILQTTEQQDENTDESDKTSAKIPDVASTDTENSLAEVSSTEVRTNGDEEQLPKTDSRCTSLEMKQVDDQDKVICATFEKTNGRTKDFMLYSGRKTCNTPGLLFRNIDPKSQLYGIIRPQDQLIKVNDQYVKNSDIHSVNHLLDNLSGSVTLEVQRKNSKQVLKEIDSNVKPFPGKNIEMKTKRDSIQRIRAKIKSKMPEKSIDDVDDVMEMAEIFKLLKIDYDRRKLNLEKMKKQAKEVLEEQSSGSGKYLKGTTGFGVIANAKEDDNLKRKKLKQMYFDVATCLQDLDEDALVIMNSYYSGGGVFASLSEQIGRLGKRDYNLLIAGDHV